MLASHAPRNGEVWEELLKEVGQFLFVIIFPGALGGILRVLRKNETVANHLVHKQALAGVGGALGIMFILTVTSSVFPDPIEDLGKKWQFFFALFFVAGYIGHGILSIAAGRLQEQLTDGKRRPDERSNPPMYWWIFEILGPALGAFLASSHPESRKLLGNKD